MLGRYLVVKGQNRAMRDEFCASDESVEGLDEMDLTIDYEQKFGNIQDPKIMAQEKLDRCEKPLIGKCINVRNPR